MTTVLSHLTMSLDGFVAHPDDTVDGLFDWYDAGEVAVRTAHPDIGFHLDPASAALLDTMTARTGALVCGRRLFDITDGWGDRHPVGAPVVVVTHRPPADADRWPRTTFVGSVEEAVTVARGIAGERDVTIASPTIAQQALALGLLDEVHVSLAPIVLGRGIPYFAGVGGAPYRLTDPEVVTGTRATHLRFGVVRAEAPAA